MIITIPFGMDLNLYHDNCNQSFWLIALVKVAISNLTHTSLFMEIQTPPWLILFTSPSYPSYETDWRYCCSEDQAGCMVGGRSLLPDYCPGSDIEKYTHTTWSCC